MTNGPGKLCQALKIDKNFFAHNLSKASLKLIKKDSLSSKDITSTTRIGISKAKDKIRRFYITGNKFVSKF